MIVYVDTVIFDLQKAGGISVYFYEIIKRMLVDKEIEAYFIVSDDTKDNVYWNKLSLPQDRIVKYGKFLNRYRSVNYKEERKHIFISSYYRYSTNKNAVNITVVHDFTYEYYSSGLRKSVHHYQKMKAIDKSAKVICISQNTQRDLNKFCKKNVPSVVIYNGVSNAYRVMSDDEIKSGLELFDPSVAEVIGSKKYVLFIGQRGGYKNWKAAVEVFKTCPQDYYMISVGGGELTAEEMSILGDASERHIKLNAMTEEQLCVLYNKAHCLLYLSEYEGFGLPVAEAQQCGCPVIAMNRSSIPEIAQVCESVYLVDNINDNILIKDLKRVDPQVVKFSWDKTYGSIVNLCKEFIE